MAHNSDRCSRFELTFIYVIFCGNAISPRCKIGHSYNPWDRLVCLQVGAPFRLRLVKTWEVRSDQAVNIEKEVHESLKDRRVTGEWFRVAEWDAMEAVRKVLYRRKILRWPSELLAEAHTEHDA